MVVIEPHNSKVNVSYVEMVLVIDNGVYKRKESDLNLVHGYCKDIVNYLNLVSKSRHCKHRTRNNGIV